MAFYGAPPEAIAKARADYAPSVVRGPYDVMHANVVAVRVFQALQTQWRTVGISTMSAARIVRTGLDYSAIAPTALAWGIELGDGDMPRLAYLEATALNAWAAEASK